MFTESSSQVCTVLPICSLVPGPAPIPVLTVGGRWLVIPFHSFPVIMARCCSSRVIPPNRYQTTAQAVVAVLAEERTNWWRYKKCQRLKPCRALVCWSQPKGWRLLVGWGWCLPGWWRSADCSSNVLFPESLCRQKKKIGLAVGWEGLPSSPALLLHVARWWVGLAEKRLLLYC